MTHLHIFKQNEPQNTIFTSTNANEIRAQLQKYQVTFEQWPVYNLELQAIPIEQRSALIFKAYEKEVSRVMDEGGYKTSDVVSLSSDHPNKQSLREMFIKEHTHAEDEVRFFVKGSGLFVFHFDDLVFMLKTAPGDFISVPKNSKHWFDMGAEPEFTCIRFFNNQEGWVAHYTGSTISQSFPNLDTLSNFDTASGL